MAEAIAPRRKRPSLTGLLVRLGPGPTLLGGPDTGLDDATFARFVRETFDAEDRAGGARAWGRPTRAGSPPARSSWPARAGCPG